MKWSKKDKDRINKAVKKWKHKMFLGAWRIQVFFTDQGDDDLENARVVTSSRYRQATIWIRPAILDSNDIEEVICHEMVHVIIAPILELLTSSIDGSLVGHEAKAYFHESVTTDLTNIIYYKS